MSHPCVVHSKMMNSARHVRTRARLLSAATNREPPPLPGRQSVVDHLIAMLRARRRFGLRKYGTELQTWNGRNPHVDGFQELLDLFQYLDQAWLQHEDLTEQLERARTLLGAAVPHLPLRLSRRVTRFLRSPPVSTR